MEEAGETGGAGRSGGDAIGAIGANPTAAADYSTGTPSVAIGRTPRSPMAARSSAAKRGSSWRRAAAPAGVVGTPSAAIGATATATAVLDYGGGG